MHTHTHTKGDGSSTFGETMKHRFEDYTLRVGRTNAGNLPYASLDEFVCLVATGKTQEQAVEQLREAYAERLKFHQETGKPVPVPGSGPGVPAFAPDDEIQALRPLVEDFWREILGTSYGTSFVSNDSRLESWEHYCVGGRTEIIHRVQTRYGVDISGVYDEAIPIVLRLVKKKTPNHALDKG
jgi:hypothetical protein